MAFPRNNSFSQLVICFLDNRIIYNAAGLQADSLDVNSVVVKVHSVNDSQDLDNRLETDECFQKRKKTRQQGKNCGGHL